MQIAIDITPITNKHKDRGTGLYVRYLIENLEKLKTEHKFIFFQQTDNIPVNTDLVHIPYFEPFHLKLPVFKKFKTVITIHDMIPLKFPRYFPAGLKGNLIWKIQKQLIHNFDRIITDSYCSRKDINNIMNVRYEKIDVVYLAPTIRLVSQSKASDPFSIPHQRYLMYTGDVNWNKNIPGLINGFSRFLKTGKPYKLILVGRSFTDLNIPQSREIDNLIGDLGLRNSVIRTGFLDDTNLYLCYKNAYGYIQPSYYEGFGLPVLDAMMCNTPTIVADNSSLSEIKGDSIVFNAYDISSLVQALNKLDTMTTLKRKEMGAQLRKWAEHFSWEKTASETIKSYEKA